MALTHNNDKHAKGSSRAAKKGNCFNFGQSGHRKKDCPYPNLVTGAEEGNVQSRSFPKGNAMGYDKQQRSWK